jgi:ATP/maltotriose-dependent transcriptional regulator MalT
MRAIDTAADAARARGAPADAAELLDLAIKLGGDTPLRLIRSAENHLRSGDSVRVREMLPPVLAELPPGIDRAVTLNILAGAHVLHNGLADAADLLRRAIDDARGNPAVMVQTLLALAFTRSMAGEYDEAQRVANRAVCHAEKVGVPALLSQALANQVTINALCGNGIDEAALDRALDLEDPGLDVSIMFHATAAKAQVLAWTGRLDEARVELRELRRRCSQHGADSDLFYVAVHTALVEIWRGRFDDAAQVADEAVQLAEQVGGEHAVAIARSMRAAAAAYAGRESAARADIAAALSAVAHGDTPQMAHWPMAALGFLEVSLGNYDEAAEALKQRCDEFSNMPGTEIVSANFIPDAVEAFIGLGRNAEAEPLIKALEHSGRLLDRRWMLAIGARCRAMMQAADGEVELAERTAHEALTLHEELPMPFETARTQLLLGQLQRRRRLKLAAAETISEALRAFEDMGSALWAERARAELNRTNVSPTRGSDLTPSELRVAELAGAGLTNADVAAHLSLSAKTVEANLTRIYRKLDIHSRTALVRLMQASGQ